MPSLATNFIERNCDSRVTLKFRYSSVVVVVVVVTVYSFGIVISISVGECLMHPCFRRISRNHLIALKSDANSMAVSHLCLSFCIVKVSVVKLQHMQCNNSRQPFE